MYSSLVWFDQVIPLDLDLMEEGGVHGGISLLETSLLGIKSFVLIS